jgi:hypothetical protein
MISQVSQRLNNGIHSNNLVFIHLTVVREAFRLFAVQFPGFYWEKGSSVLVSG